MHEDTSHSQAERLVAALYGELSPEEERAWQAELAGNPELRAEWEALRRTRRSLATWRVETPESSFVFLPAEPEGKAISPGWRRLLTPVWGMAAAAALLIALVAGGLRVDRVNGGMVLRFGGADPSTATLASSYPPGGGEIPVTLADMAANNIDLMHKVSAMLMDYQADHDSELAYVLQNLYESLKAEQQREVNDLKAQIQGVGMGLWAEQSWTTARLDHILGTRVSTDQAPGPDSPLNQKERQND